MPEIKQRLERGDVSQFEMLMQAIQNHAERENDRGVSELMQRMYSDMYGEAAVDYNAQAFGVNDSLRPMVEKCSLSPQNEGTRQPHMAIPYHHHNGVSHSGATAHEMSHNNPLPPPGYSTSSSFQSNPHAMQYSHCHMGPPVSHVHNNNTIPGAPVNNHNIPSGPLVPYSSTSAAPTNSNTLQDTVPLDNYSTPTTTCTIPVTGSTVTYDNLCKATPPANIAPPPPAPLLDP